MPNHSSQPPIHSRCVKLKCVTCFFTNSIEMENFITLRNSGQNRTPNRYIGDTYSAFIEIRTFSDNVTCLKIKIFNGHMTVERLNDDVFIFLLIFYWLQFPQAKSAGWLSSKATEQTHKSPFSNW